MLLIGSPQINQLNAEFDPARERDIAVPFRDGRWGNPVCASYR